MSVIHHADVLDALRAMPDNSFHGCLTDPPYGLSFMGHQWDHGVPSAEVWREVLRVLRPGAALLAFGGTRTFHRLTCAIEDAGFEVRDCLMWLYGSGFPKSLDVSKAIDKANGDHRGKAGKVTSENGAMGGPNYARTPKGDPIAAAAQYAGHGTALKPAWEPIFLARKPLDGTVAQNVQRWGCGALAIDASRVGTYATQGRWPANVILSHSPECVEVGTREVVSHGISYSTAGKRSVGYNGGWMGTGKPTGPCSTVETVAKFDCAPGCPVAALDAQSGHGGASRFFYCTKASKAERNAGTEGGNPHPCVKPLALATYLARLILPPVEGSRLLVPFCGSGSEMLGGTRAGWSHVEGIDSWDVAVKIARARTA